MAHQNRYRRVVTPAPKRKPNATLTIGGHKINVTSFTATLDPETFCTDDFDKSKMPPGMQHMSGTIEGWLTAGAFASLPPPEWVPLPEHLYDEVREDYATGELYVEIDDVRYRVRVHEPDEPEREYDFDPPKDWTPEDE